MACTNLRQSCILRINRFNFTWWKTIFLHFESRRLIQKNAAKIISTTAEKIYQLKCY